MKSRRIDWSKIRQNFPSHVTVNNKTYEVLWCDQFTDPRTVGEKRVDPNQIVLKRNESDKETVKTLIHEFFHAIGDEFEVPLTEKQVSKLEKATPDMIRFFKEIL